MFYIDNKSAYAIVNIFEKVKFKALPHKRQKDIKDSGMGFWCLFLRFRMILQIKGKEERANPNIEHQK